MLDLSNDEDVMEIAWEKVELKANLPEEMDGFYDQHGAVPTRPGCRRVGSGGQRLEPHHERRVLVRADGDLLRIARVARSAHLDVDGALDDPHGIGQRQVAKRPPVDDDLAAGLSERKGAAAPEPAARGTDDGLTAGNSEIHGSSAC